LKQILVSPLRDRKILQKRLENIRYLIKLNDLSDLIENLKQVGDIQRLVTKILYKKNLPSLWLRLKNYLTPIIKIVNSGKYTRFINFPPGVEKIYKQINKILKDEITSDEIDFIKD
jgi:DNA mismatch repair protein MutS